MTGAERAERVTVRRTRPKVAQAAPGATTDTTLYTVPPGYSAYGRVYVTNRDTGAATFRIAVRPAGATLANEHYIAYDAPLPGNEDAHTAEIADLDGTDVITVRASTGNLSFSWIGREEPKAT